jgi:hypothetical protein
MAIDEQHIALPKLYGAPAYARPVPPVDVTPRPFDPDDLPIEAVLSVEDRDAAGALSGRSYDPTALNVTTKQSRFRRNERPMLRPIPLSLRALAGRVLGNE